MSQEIINKTAEYVKSLCAPEPGHDWSHVERVWKLSKVIAEKENVNTFIVEMAALLHDVDDWKFSEAKKVGPYLESLNLTEQDCNHIINAVETVSFKGGHNTPPITAEAKVVQDSDRLDAIGAIGIARAFSYGGYKQRPLYDKQEPRNYSSFQEFQSSNSSTVNHFYEKLLKLKDMMNTNTAKRIAEQRHDFMIKYLDQFMNEWG